ncbi:MAG: hypothetical protein R3B70_35220 [Polyangiaceae bacterium]
MDELTPILTLIRRYLETTSRLVTEMQRELGHRDLLRAVNGRLLARDGALKGGARYSFHGVGCEIDDGTLVVDLDFGPDARFDGFDAWRLASFASQFPELASFHDPNVVKRNLEELHVAGRIIFPRWEPSPHLYYLAS